MNTDVAHRYGTLKGAIADTSVTITTTASNLPREASLQERQPERG